jgi:hypothetical protein
VKSISIISKEEEFPAALPEQFVPEPSSSNEDYDTKITLKIEPEQKAHLLFEGVEEPKPESQVEVEERGRP